MASRKQEETAVVAGLYCRISEDDADEQGGSGGPTAVERQEAACRRIAAERGWTVDDDCIYVDEGKSAYSIRRTVRPEFKRIISDFETGRINSIVIWDVDRLYRHPLEVELLLDKVDELGLAGVIVSDEEDFDLSKDAHRDRLRYEVSRAHRESRQRSKRVKAWHAGRARKGIPAFSNAPKRRIFGYEPDSLTLRPDEANLIRQAAKRLLAGDSLNGIAKEWNAKGVRTSQGNEWSYVAVKKVVTRPRNAGFAHHGSKDRVNGKLPTTIEETILLDDDGKYVRGQWEPTLDEQTYFRLLRKLEDPDRRTNFDQSKGRKYLLTGGLSTCGGCGEPLKPRPREGGYSSGDARCYGCRSGNNCGLRQRATPLEAFIRDAIIRRLDSKSMARLLKAATGEAKQEQKLLVELARVSDKLNELYDDYYSHGLLVDKAHFVRQKELLEARREAIRRLLAKNEKTNVICSLPHEGKLIYDAWEERGIAWRQSLTKVLIEKVVIHPAEKRGQNAFDPSRVEVVWRV